MKPRTFLLLIFLVTLFPVTGCRSDPTIQPTATATSTPLPPTETPIPLAALVNGEPTYLADFEAEVTRFQDARGIDLATSEVNELVLGALIDRKLLAQSASMSGYSFEEAMIDQKIDKLIDDLGEETSLQAWLQSNHYTMASFRSAFAEESLASAMIELIVDQVSKLDVHAKALHILVATEEEAQQLHDQILAGADFSELAVLYSLDLSTRPAGGDLGWFAKGTLTIPEVEEIVFSLQPGDLSEVIGSELGYHIIQLIDLEERPLSFQLLETRREQAVESWLRSQREIAEIEIFLVP
jgi:parvulin-like peptidyl-prolyl isomerase